MKKELEKYDLTPLQTYPIEKTHLSIILDTRREKSDGYYPIKYRVTFLSKQFYYSCIDIPVEDYSSLHGEVRRKDLVDQKKLILAGFDNIKKLIEGMFKDGTFSLELLNKKLSKGRKDSIIVAFDNRIDKLNEAGKVGSSVWFRSARNSIKTFLQDKDLKFSDVTPEWLKKYEDHLLEEEFNPDGSLKRKAKKYTTISINMRALRAIINEGKADGVISDAQYPFCRSIKERKEKYQIPDGEGRKIALSEAQLYKVFDYPLNPNEEKYRDLWIFSFYCNGANFNDILRFKYDNIKDNNIEWYRKKTKDTGKKKIIIKAIITEEMQQIITKWGNPDHRSHNYIFPYLRQGLSPLEERMIIQNLIHTVNKRMTKIGQALEYGDITTYWARHSWASISRHKEISLFSISKGMGHKNLSTTQIYLDSLSDDELKENSLKMPRRNNK